MSGLRVLITNKFLIGLRGTELYVRDLAMGLLDRGHTPIVYSTNLGPFAQELRSKTIPVVNNLNSISLPPDVIHGQHNIEMMTALLRFPYVPAVYFFHDNLAWHDIPPHFPRILRYVAVDYTCRDRLIYEYAISDNRIRVISNSVNLKLFKPRGPLPVHPERALVFSNTSSEYLEAVRDACEQSSIALDVIRAEKGNECAHPETVLGNYDLVFAKGRCALEALAVGTAVVLGDHRGIGPMVAAGELNRLRSLNFGHRSLRWPITSKVLMREIARYDPVDATEVSRRIRATACCDGMVDEIISLYRDVIAEYKATDKNKHDVDAEGRATSEFLRWLTLSLKQEQDAILQLRTFRLRERLLRAPVIGALVRSYIRKTSSRSLE